MVLSHHRVFLPQGLCVIAEGGAMSVSTQRLVRFIRLVLLLGLCTIPRLARAHMLAAPLASYGNSGPAADCQRVIARATRICCEVAARAELNCANAKLAGDTCTAD